MIVDARLNRNTTTQDDINWCKKSPEMSRLSTKRLMAFLDGQPVKTRNPITGRRLVVILANPKKGRDKNQLNYASPAIVNRKVLPSRE